MRENNLREILLKDLIAKEELFDDDFVLGFIVGRPTHDSNLDYYIEWVLDKRVSIMKKTLERRMDFWKKCLRKQKNKWLKEPFHLLRIDL